MPSVLTNSGWRLNFRGGADIEVTLRGRRRPARAALIEEPDTVARAYMGVINRLGWQAAQRRLGIRVNVGRTVDVEHQATDLAVARDDSIPGHSGPREAV
jgi:hypothetical protein